MKTDKLLLWHLRTDTTCEYQQTITFIPREKLRLTIATTALLISTLFIFGPIKMYAGNVDELWFPFSYILPVLSIFSLGLFLILAAVCYFIPVHYGRFLLALIFGLGIAFYIEGTFMPMDYGLLDGKVIEWDKYADRIFYDNIIWSLCIVLPLLLLVLKSDLFKKLVPLVCAALILMQGAELISALPNIVGQKIGSDYLTDNGMFTIGKEENIIVIMLDCLDHRMFERSISNSKELANSFKDFIHYENSMSGFNYTQQSIPSILTGINYDNSIPFNEYISIAYEQFPLLQTLFNAGYDSRLFTFQGLTPINHKRIKAYISNKSLDNEMRYYLTPIMCQFTLMRYVPAYFKENFWLSYDSFEKVKYREMEFSNLGKDTNTDLSFYTKLKQDGLKLIEGKAFRFYHFQGVHDYINMDSNLNIVKDYKNADLATLDQAEGSLKITAEFLKEMKEGGVYENSTIIITGDHSRISDPTMAYYLAPVMLIKNKSANFPFMKKSSAPVINSDIAATIMDIIHPDNDFGGIAIHKLDENKARTRKYYFNNGYAHAKKGYFPDMIEFINENITLHPEDFKMTGNILSGNGIGKHTYNYYQLGKHITSEDVTHDWSESKADKKIYGVRAVIGSNNLYSGDVFKTAGASSTLGFTLSESGRELGIMMVAASAFEKDDPQRLFIEVNGTQLSEEFLFTNGDFKKVKINIPKELIKEDKRLVLNLLTPDAKQRRNPFEYIIYFREALVIKSLVIGTAKPVHQILFGCQEKNNSDEYKGEGWHVNEEKHTWSKEKAELFLPLDPTKDATLDFQLVFLHEQDDVKININGHDLGYWKGEISGSEWAYHKQLVLPQHWLAKDGMNKLVLTMPKPIRSSRILGIPLMSITME